MVSVPLITCSYPLILVNYFFWILWIDSLRRDGVSARIVVIFLCLVASFNLFLLAPGSITFVPTQYGDLNVALSSPFLMLYMIILLFISLYVLLYFLKIYRVSPRSLKYHARLLLVSTITIGIITPVLMLTVDAYIGGLSTLNNIIGLIIAIYIFLKKPQLFFVLPFKALRLSIINTNSGILLYSHTWSRREDLINDELFSSMLQGISLILNESVKKGNVCEIHLDQAILILHRSEDYPVACVLVSSKSSRSLRDALESFAGKFYSRFSRELEKSLPETSKFAATNELILDCFSFIPKYD
ncbi:MAG: hypothetical protein ACFFCS_24290 [Candidatus Hodarchaeota archaeon]